MNQKPRKKLSCLLMAGIMLALLFISGCKISKDDGKKVRDLEFTVVGEVDIPAELKQIITGKLSQPFKLTFSDEQATALL